MKVLNIFHTCLCLPQTSLKHYYYNLRPHISFLIFSIYVSQQEVMTIQMIKTYSLKSKGVLRKIEDIQQCNKATLTFRTTLTFVMQFRRYMTNVCYLNHNAPRVSSITIDEIKLKPTKFGRLLFSLPSRKEQRRKTYIFYDQPSKQNQPLLLSKNKVKIRTPSTKAVIQRAYVSVTHFISVVPKVCSQGIHGGISVMITCKFTYFLLKK